MNKYTICIISETNNTVSIRGIYNKHIDALNNIKLVAKNYVQEITLESDLIIKLYDKSIDEIKLEAADNSYFLKTEGNGCGLYKKESEQCTGLLSYVCSSAIPIVKKIAQIIITNFDLTDEIDKNKDKINDKKIEISRLINENTDLKNSINVLEDINSQLRESIRILRVEKSQLQEVQEENLRRQKNIDNQYNKTNVEYKTPIKIPRKIGNLAYIEEMMSFLNTQVCDPQQLIKPSKMKKKMQQ